MIRINILCSIVCVAMLAACVPVALEGDEDAGTSPADLGGSAADQASSPVDMTSMPVDMMASASDMAGMTSNNPFTTDDMAAVMAGQMVYANNCAGCHGADGNGSVSGFDFKVRSASQGDDTLFAIIKNGSENQRMPAYGGSLSDDQIWQSVTYIRAEFIQ